MLGLMRGRHLASAVTVLLFATGVYLLRLGPGPEIDHYAPLIYEPFGNATTLMRLEKRVGGPIDAVELISLIRSGMDTIQMLLDETDFAALTRQMTCLFGEDPWNNGWQRTKPSGAETDHEFTMRPDRLWTLDEYYGSAPEVFAQIRRALGSLQVGVAGGAPDPAARYEGDKLKWTSLRNVDTRLWPDGPNFARSYVQNRGFNGNPQTNAMYASVYNLLDGVIVVQHAAGPETQRLVALAAAHQPQHVDPATLPVFRQWSDCTWRIWKKLHGSPTASTESVDASMMFARPPLNEVGRRQFAGPMVAWLNYIIIQSISNPSETLTIINACLSARGKRTFAQQTSSTWGNHETYPVGHWCFYALLTTKNVYGSVWMLVQHRRPGALGWKQIKSITIFWGDLAPNSIPLVVRKSSYPTVILELTGDHAAVEALEEEYEAGWSNFPNYGFDTVPGVYTGDKAYPRLGS